MDDQPPGGGAALPRRANGAEHDRAHRQVQPGVLGDDDGVVAAELEDGAPEPGGDGLGDVPADACRSGEGDERQPAIVQHPLADDRSAPDHQRKHPLDAVIGHDAVGDVLHGDGGERRRLGRLPDHRVAAHGGNCGVPGPDGDGKIERGDDAGRPERMPLLHHPVARTFGGEREAVELPRQADGEVADIDHLLHFAVSLGADLPHLDRDQVAERLLQIPERVPEIAHEIAALGGRTVAPRRKRALRRRHDLFVRRLARERDRAKRVARRRVGRDHSLAGP